jgi:hypothetical protein
MQLVIFFTISSLQICLVSEKLLLRKLNACVMQDQEECRVSFTAYDK